MSTRKYLFRGKMLTVTELAPFSEVCKHTIYTRLDAGCDVERALKKETYIKKEMSVANVNRDEYSFNKRHKARPYSGMPDRLFSEAPLSTVKTKEKKASRHFKAVVRSKDTPCECIVCGHTGWRSPAKIRKYDKNGYKCFECSKKEKKEFDQAMINLARRKGLIK